MRRPIHWAAAVGAGLLLTLCGAIPASAGGVPELKVESDHAATGEEIAVSVSGWPMGDVQITICGNRADSPDTDCDQASAVTATVGADGTAAATYRIGMPPVGCPCAVRAADSAGEFTAWVPFTVTDAPVLPGFEEPELPAHALTVTRAALTGSSWGALFGGGAKRTLVLTVRNSGSVPVADLALSVAVGRGSSPTSIVSAPAIETLAVGEESTYRVPVTLDGPAFGSYTVRGEIFGLDQPLVFDTRTASYPWGLLVAVPLAALAVWRRKRLGALIRRPSRAGVSEPS